MNNLKGKNVFVYCPSFFGYDVDITLALQRAGANVSLYNERVFDGFLGRALIRLRLTFFIRLIVEIFYYRNLICKAQDIDYVLLINPETIPMKMLTKLKSLNSSVIILTYMWDSFENKKTARKYIKDSDVYYTFDLDDAELYGIKHLPLFYTPEYAECDETNFEYDILFIGTAHSDRFKVVDRICNMFPRSFSYFYCPNFLVFYYKKLIKNELCGLSYFDVNFESITKSEVIEKINKSRIVIDIAHPRQNGLTMRCIEMVGAKKKIITTNANVSKYDFYNSSNVLILNENTTDKEIIDFSNKPFVPIEKSVYVGYNIDNWIRKIFASA